MLLAGASGVMGYQFVLPAWGWTLIAVGCAFWIAWRAERELYDDKHSKIECDMALVDVVTKIVGSSNFLIDGNQSKVSETLIRLRELSHLGKLTVWGRRGVTAGTDFHSFPRSEISGPYWYEFEVGYLDFLKDKLGVTSYARGKKEFVSDEIYRDLYFSHIQVEKLWPASAKKTMFRWPLHRVNELPPKPQGH
jgi:hypothetical protein